MVTIQFQHKRDASLVSPLSPHPEDSEDDGEEEEDADADSEDVKEEVGAPVLASLGSHLTKE